MNNQIPVVATIFVVCEIIFFYKIHAVKKVLDLGENPSRKKVDKTSSERSQKFQEFSFTIFLFFMAHFIALTAKDSNPVDWVHFFSFILVQGYYLKYFLDKNKKVNQVRENQPTLDEIHLGLEEKKLLVLKLEVFREKVHHVLNQIYR